MKKLPLLLLCGFVAGASLAYDPYQDQERFKQTQQDPERFDRPTTNTLKGAEIKEFRDKMNAVKAQVFKDGNVPDGAAFRATTKDAAGDHFQAEGKFDQFTGAVQSQILTKFPNAETTGKNILVDVTLGADSVNVDSAKLTDSKTPTVKNQVPTQSLSNPNSVAPSKVSVPTMNVPRLEPPRPSVVPNRARELAVPPQTGVNAALPAKGVNVESNPNTLPKENSVNQPKVVENKNSVEQAKPPLSQVVKQLAADAGGVVRAAQPVAVGGVAKTVLPVAVIPIAGGNQLVVSVKESKSDSTTIEVRGSAQALPEAIKNRIKTDLPDSAGTLNQKGDVAVVIALKPARASAGEPDKTFSVLSVQPVIASEAKQSVFQKQVSIDKDPERRIASDPSGPRNDAFVHAFAPAGTKSEIGKADPRLLEAAKALAPLIGADPKSVTVENRPTTIPVSHESRLPAGGQAQAVVLALQNGDEISVEEVAGGKEEVEPAYRAKATFGDLSPKLKEEITAKLSEFGGQTLVKDDTKVEIGLVAHVDDTLAVTEVSIKISDQPTEKAVLLWKGEEPAPMNAPPKTSESEPAKPAENRSPSQKQSTPAPILPTASAPAFARTEGLAPAVAAMIQNGYGFERGKFEIKNIDVRGNVQVTVPQASKNISLAWMEASEGLAANFSVLGKPLDFTDKIREAVYAKLREAVENGEMWATEALNGKKEIVVEFELLEGATKGDKIVVKTVSPTMRDAALELARNMGLEEGDFEIVNVAQQWLIVLEQGRTGQVKVGDKSFKLKSPDGDAKVFIKQNRAKKDVGVLLMLSRKSLEANRDTLVRLTGKDAALITQTLKENPNTDQFFVRVDPNSEEQLVIKPISAGAKDGSVFNKVPEKKP